MHAIVTDPPYGLSQVDSVKLTTALTAWVNGDRERVPGGKGFMGKEWDAFVPPPAVFDECLRVLKPGGHMLVFAGSRTVDLMGLSIRLAGFEIRDTLQWLYGSGFPKSQNVSKALDKLAGAEREVVGTYKHPGRNAREWEGWGTALKPAAEPILLARKPLESTVTRNVLAHGVGGINIDGCRVGSETRVNPAAGNKPGGSSLNMSVVGMPQDAESREATGRFPANVVLSHNEECDTDQCAEGCAVAELDAQSGFSVSPTSTGRGASRNRSSLEGGVLNAQGMVPAPGDSGGASRFFASFRYQAKAPKSERPKVDGVSHPTVKPVALMRWLVRLVTPPGGTVLDPFAGSGTTLQAAREEGFASIGVEREPDYMRLISARLASQEESAA